MKDNSKRFDKGNKPYKNRNNKSRNTFKGEKEMVRQSNILTGEVHSSVLPTYLQNDQTRSQFVNFVFKEMIYQPYGTNNTASSPINIYAQNILDTAISSTTRNSTSARALNSWKQRHDYLTQVAQAYAYYASLSQFINYYYAPASMNYGINYAGRVLLDANLLNAFERLGGALELHAMPKRMQTTADNLFQWRQSGDSAESAIIGLTTLPLSEVNIPTDLIADTLTMITRLEDLTKNDSQNDFVCANIQSTINKQGIDWSITLPNMPGILAYEKEYLTLFLHTPTSRANIVFPKMPDTYSYIEGALTPFTCAHIMDPKWAFEGILVPAVRTASGTSYTIAKNTIGGFERVNVGTSDIAVSLIGLPTWFLQTNGSSTLINVINQIPGGRLVRGITDAQPDMIQEYLYDMYDISQLKKNYTNRRY